jgi:hypothetical protein
MASNGHRSWLLRVMKLAVASLGSSEPPSVLLKTLDYVADFHPSGL